MSRTGKAANIEDCLHCAKCRTRVKFVEEHPGPQFASDEIILFKCTNSSCKERPWFFCRSCDIRAHQNSLLSHSERNKHIANHAKRYTSLPPPPPPAAPPPPPLPPAFDPYETTLDDYDVDKICQETIEDQLVGTSNLIDYPMDDSYAGLPVEDSKPPADEGMPTIFPKINLQGNEWLQDLLKSTPRATSQEIQDSFSAHGLDDMANFWITELGSGEGRCGGGIMYLAARAFQQEEAKRLNHGRFPEYQEACWQFHNLVQYQSMNERQRFRQHRLYYDVFRFLPPDTFFKQTYLPEYKHLNSVYGKGDHSMFTNLPCPKAIDVDGVAYTSPFAIVSFMMANGIPVDDFYVTADAGNAKVGDGKVHNVEDCRKAKEWIQEVHQAHFATHYRSTHHDAIVLLPVSDWQDGFEPAKVKTNRNPIVSKTMTISPPKSSVNGTENTFLVAVGLKKAKGWRKVEAMFRRDLEAITGSKEPLMFYNGVLQKMVPCLFRRFAVVSDKQEKNGLTGTTACTSDLHRTYGISGNVKTPSVDLDRIEAHLKKEVKGKTKSHCSWSHDFVMPNNNGAHLPYCTECRARGVASILFHSGNYEKKACPDCHGWNLMGDGGKDPMTFMAHKDYPTWFYEDCPVKAPVGRDIFHEGAELPFVSITWELMTQASKFAFYHAMGKRGSCWTKENVKVYLKHCGVSESLAVILHDCARACHDSGQADQTSYTSKWKIGDFEFHPSWLSDEVALTDFIEAIMHQLFLGAAESNYELSAKWMKELPKGAKVPHAGFQGILQGLIKDLRGFGLSWLLAYPLTGKKGKLGMGSWVAENWVFFTRVSQFVYGWCVRDYKNSSNYGVDDLSRMVIAYHCFVARCLTHNGINDECIAETELYMKEFLSALREFDMRVRHKNLNKPCKIAAEKKKSEAWWLKPNYMSLCNLIFMMSMLGPLVLWWDGGGKGERYIQTLKPHIKNGIRGDALAFFRNLLEKIYRTRQLELLEKKYELGPGFDKDDDGPNAVFEVLNEVANTFGTEDDSEEEEEDGESTEENIDSDDSDREEESDDEEDDAQCSSEDFIFSQSEIHGMTKGRNIYVYKNEAAVLQSVAALKPLAGIVRLKECGKAFEFQMVYRKPVKLYARRNVRFEDSNGKLFHGLWCAGVQVEEENSFLTTDFGRIQKDASLAAVALPLRYVLGDNEPDSNKYCVITNWWKCRTKDGSYSLPELNPKLYRGTQQDVLLTEAATPPKAGAERGRQSGVI